MLRTGTLTVMLAASVIASSFVAPDAGSPAQGGAVVAASPARPSQAAMPAARTEGWRGLLRGRPSSVALPPAPPEDRVSAIVAEEGLDATLLAQVAALDGVVATTPTRSATLGLFGSVAADGSVRDALPRGMRIPVGVSAIDPVSYLDVLPGPVGAEDAALVRGLTPDDVLLSARSAALRGIGAGARIDVGGRTGLRVAGVVTDDVARGSEVIVHLAAAEELGFAFGGRDALLVRSAGDAALVALDELARRSEDADDGEVRVWHGGRGVRLVLPMVEVKERFGEFAFRLVLDQREVVVDPAFVAQHIVAERMPVIGTVRCHRLIMDDLRAAVDELIAAGYEEWLSPRRYAGCFYPRRIGFGRENLSRHTWGIAIDLNVDFSLPGAGPVPPDELIAIMGRHGFRWGGDFSTPDNHHFEWVGEAAALRPDRTATDGADGT